MITKEILKNNLFTQRAQVLFINKANIEDEELDEDMKNQIFNSVIQEDVFFEIAEEF